MLGPQNLPINKDIDINNIASQAPSSRSCTKSQATKLLHRNICIALALIFIVAVLVYNLTIAITKCSLHGDCETTLALNIIALLILIFSFCYYLLVKAREYLGLGGEPQLPKALDFTDAVHSPYWSSLEAEQKEEEIAEIYVCELPSDEAAPILAFENRSYLNANEDSAQQGPENQSPHPGPSPNGIHAQPRTRDDYVLQDVASARLQSAVFGSSATDQSEENSR
ncbi:hypothetical protein NHE_0134 [Neorickettsia helminthoeca str. Oregon]|uniref:Uncharacterized protein n=1 Tax=Neorickettsia helminthoeca str. Oregon TaxID=1286528 RepID=X5H338_9RICK|nr:hypothetical protein [Neorickettsia helminthoeca]AHX11103.1 hypothetical protein NHE_0134 [Neorickettsia helminthoeca str. Oregon]